MIKGRRIAESIGEQIIWLLLESVQINKEEELAMMVLHIDATSCFMTDRSITLFITVHFFLTLRNKIS
jgi:hypothetical protein